MEARARLRASGAKRPYSVLARMALRGSTILFKFGVSLFLARYFGLDVVGAYGLIVGLTAIAPVLLQMGVFNSLARDAVTLPADELAVELHRYYSIVAIAYLALTLVSVVVTSQAFPTITHTNVFLIVCIILAEQVGQEICTLLTNRGRLTPALVVGLAQGLCWGIPLAVFAIWSPQHRNLEVLLVCWAAGAMTPLLFIACGLRAYLAPTAISPAALGWFRDRAKAAGMLYGAELTGCAAQYVDRYMIGIFYGLKEAGIYFLFLQVANAIFNLVNSSLVQSYRPNLIAAYHKGEAGVARTIHRELRWATLTTLLIASIMSAAIFPSIFELIGRPEAAHLSPLLWAVLAAMMCKVNYFMSTLSLYAQHRDRTLFQLEVGLFTLVVMLSYLAIQSENLYAFPAANAAAYLTLALINQRRQTGVSASAMATTPTK